MILAGHVADTDEIRKDGAVLMGKFKGTMPKVEEVLAIGEDGIGVGTGEIVYGNEESRLEGLCEHSNGTSRP
jgi:hypothetical protein